LFVPASKSAGLVFFSIEKWKQSNLYLFNPIKIFDSALPNKRSNCFYFISSLTRSDGKWSNICKLFC